MYLIQDIAEVDDTEGLRATETVEIGAERI